MPRVLPAHLASLVLALGPIATGLADDRPGPRRRQSQEFHRRAQERAGVLVPMYVYPADVHTNPAYNRLMDAKRRFATVPMWVIVNPASGPGHRVDANYTKAIDRLIGARCVVLGYVGTSYGKRPAAEIRRDVERWHALYPRVQGIFFDEMLYEDAPEAVEHQAALNRHAHDAGF